MNNFEKKSLVINILRNTDYSIVIPKKDKEEYNSLLGKIPSVWCDRVRFA